MLKKTYSVNNDFIITLNGHFDADTVNNIKDDVEAYSKLNTNIIFDLKHVAFIDSSGIGAIVFLYKRLAVKGFRVSILGLSNQPLELFQMLFLDKTINCYSTFDCYLQSSQDLQVAS